MKKKILAEIDKRITMNAEILHNHERETDSISSVKTCERCLARLNELHALHKIISKLK
jgi:hypothetical protein